MYKLNDALNLRIGTQRVDRVYLGDVLIWSRDPAANFVALPLTYDENDYEGTMTWARLGNGPHVTPAGFEGDGYGSRLKSTDIPSWMSGADAALTMHASISFFPQKLGATSQFVLFAGEDDSTPQGKMGYFVIPDVSNSGITQLCLRAGTGGTSFVEKDFGRSSWKFQFRTPDLVDSTFDASPQAIAFLDEETILLSAHFEEHFSRVYKIRLSDAAVLGSFDADGDFVHLACLAFRSNGDLWALAASNRACRIDLANSFSTGSLVTLDEMDFIGITIGALDFVTVSGTEYAVIPEYLTSGSPYIYVIPASSFGSVTLTTSDRTKRFTGCPIEVQGCAMRSGKLVTSSIAQPGAGTSNRFGYIGRFDIVTAIGSTSDGGAISSDLNLDAASKYVEDCAIHPSTNDLWTPTEGISAVGSDAGGLSVWSSSLDGSLAENHYTAEYDGSSTITIKVNNRPYDSLSATPAIDVAVVSVGAQPQATAGYANKFFSGFIRNIVFEDAAMTQQLYEAAVGGHYEPNELAAYVLVLTNPGAEASTATGWTNESGTLSIFNTASLAPHSGAYSFYAGNTASFQARQRLDLVAQTGLTGTDLDSAVGWTKIRWWQSSFDGTDPGCAGVRNVNGAGTQLTLATAGSAATPNSTGAGGSHPWYPRAFALALESGVRSVDAILKASRTGGTNNDCYYDDIAMTMYVR
jgi:hypothetical protein